MEDASFVPEKPSFKLKGIRISETPSGETGRRCPSHFEKTPPLKYILEIGGNCPVLHHACIKQKQNRRPYRNHSI